MLICFSAGTIAYSIQDQRNVLIILDASGSMDDQLNGTPKWELAKRSIRQMLSSMPNDVRVGLRVYGHKAFRGAGLMSLFDDSGDTNCRQSELLIPIAYNTQAAISRTLDGLEPTGRTPITYSIQRAVYDFTNLPGNNSVILVSDGAENCATIDPCEMAVQLQRSKVKLKINVIGFGLNDPVAESQLKCVALTTKARFYSTDNVGDLTQALQDTVRSTTSVEARVITEPDRPATPIQQPAPVIKPVPKPVYKAPIKKPVTRRY